MLSNERQMSTLLPLSHYARCSLNKIGRELWESLKDDHLRKQRIGTQEMLPNCFSLDFPPAQSNSENI